MLDNKCHKTMKSEKAKKYIDNDTIEFRNGDRMLDASTAYIAVEIAEDDMVDNACRLFEQFMSGVFTGDTPSKMAQEFKQKLME